MVAHTQSMMKARHVGIVAVSAEGAALCYRTLCVEGAAFLGRHAHPPVSMHTYPLSDYMRLIEAGDWDGVGDLMARSARILCQAGAELLVCPDNTAHQAYDRAAAAVDVPWIHIAEEVAREATRQGYLRLGILGTRLLMEGPVYPSRLAPRGIAHAIPPPEDRSRIDAVIFEELVCGRFTDESRAYFVEIISRLGEQGCDAVVLGCTEIPLLVAERDSPLPVLDSTRILARAALREATGAPQDGTPEIRAVHRPGRSITMPGSTYNFLDKLPERHLHELHALYQGEWWTRGRSLGDVKRMLEHSDFVFALCSDPEDRLVAFARVLTDRVFKALIFDLIVAPDRREQGLGRLLMEQIVQHPDLRDVRHLELYCLPEIVPFYEKWGFSTDVSRVNLMRRTAG